MTAFRARNVIHISACASFVLLVAMVTRSVDGNRGKCPAGKFGQLCRLTCNCQDNADCDYVTGKCPGPCAEGWSGPHCQRQNVVLGMPTDMKTSEWSKGARAVDGDIGTCVTSSSNRTGWWRVDMLVQRTVFFMEIIFANQSARSGRIRVYVSDYVDTFWGKPCTKIAVSHKTSHFSCDLPSSGRFFGIINKDGQITLCEVSVFVCSPYTFDVNCSKECFCSDPTEVCNTVTGSCNTGCRDGYTGTSCTTPCMRRYGKTCRYSCGHCYNNQPCDHVTGMCLQGCAAGWAGSLCNQTCQAGTYGVGCSHNCHHCLDNVTCDAANGLCPWRCEPGWKGHRCDKECEPGRHGQSCEFHCGHCYGTTVCDRLTGICFSGCSPGFEGLFCTSECLPRHWGSNCRSVCGRCLSHMCDKVTGHCSNLGCKPGWSGPRCDIECRRGSFGRNCALQCGYCQSSCGVIDGTCTTQCMSGWTGRTCVDRCRNNTYGPECASDCGNCDNNEPCHHITGYCPSGCIKGYRKPLCFIHAGTLMEQLGKPNLLTFLVGCMLFFCCTLVGVFSCLLFKWRQEINRGNICVTQCERQFKQTVV